MKIENIKDLIDKSVSGELQIPEFQREYVWDKEQIKMLIDSLYRNYTINSILIWEGGDELARRRVGGPISDIDFPNSKNKIITYLLDGQQRTTTLTSIFSNIEIYKGNSKVPIKYSLFIDIEDFDESNEDGIIDKLLYDDEKIENGEEDIKLKDYSLAELYNKYGLKYIPLKAFYMEEIENEINDFIFNLEDVKKFSKITRLFKQNILDRKVHVIDQEGRLEQVLDIFERINTKNTKLNMFDIMVAKTYKKIGEQYFDLRSFIKLIKSKKALSSNNYFDEIENIGENEIYKFNDDKELLFTIMLFLQEKKQVKEREILKITTDDLINNYKKVNKLFRQLIDELEKFKIQSGNYNKFKPIIKFIALYISVHGVLDRPKIDFLNKRFWNTVLYNRYSGAQNERIQKDFYELDLDNYYIKLQKSRNRIFDETLDAYYNKQSNQLFTAIELLMLNNGVKDFYNGTEVTRGTANNSKMELHHIFPENSSIGKEIKKRGDNMLNNIANLTPLTKDTNNKFINNKSPSLYIKNFREQIGSEKFSEYLKTHFISEEMIDILERDDFDGFIKERTKLIIEKIQELADCK